MQMPAMMSLLLVSVGLMEALQVRASPTVPTQQGTEPSASSEPWKERGKNA